MTPTKAETPYEAKRRAWSIIEMASLARQLLETIDVVDELTDEQAKSVLARKSDLASVRSMARVLRAALQQTLRSR